MWCPACKTNQAVQSWEKDDPVLSCGHRKVIKVTLEMDAIACRVKVGLLLDEYLDWFISLSEYEKQELQLDDISLDEDLRRRLTEDTPRPQFWRRILRERRCGSWSF